MLLTKCEVKKAILTKQACFLKKGFIIWLWGKFLAAGGGRKSLVCQIAQCNLKHVFRTVNSISSPPIRFGSCNRTRAGMLIVVFIIWWTWDVFYFTYCVFQNATQLLHLAQASHVEHEKPWELENPSCNVRRIIASLSGRVETTKRHDETTKRHNETTNATTKRRNDKRDEPTNQTGNSPTRPRSIGVPKRRNAITTCRNDDTTRRKRHNGTTKRHNDMSKRRYHTAKRHNGTTKRRNAITKRRVEHFVQDLPSYGGQGNYWIKTRKIQMC